MSMDKKVFVDAVNSDFLKTRYLINKKLGSSDFDGWVHSIVDGMKFSSVLDICCGTGNQLIMYAGRNKIPTIIGVDISAESLLVAEERLVRFGEIEKVTLIEGKMDETFSFTEVSGKKLDLISCFYGLYYADNVTGLLNRAIDHLSEDGSILIVGPYGNNNGELFDILQKHFELPELVYRSSSTFMENEVSPILDSKLMVESKCFVNRITFPDVGSVMDYWKSTTFYKSEFERKVRSDVVQYLKSKGEFVLEKHVMAIVGKNTGNV